MKLKITSNIHNRFVWMRQRTEDNLWAELFLLGANAEGVGDTYVRLTDAYYHSGLGCHVTPGCSSERMSCALVTLIRKDRAPLAIVRLSSGDRGSWGNATGDGHAPGTDPEHTHQNTIFLTYSAKRIYATIYKSRKGYTPVPIHIMKDTNETIF